MEAPKEPDRPRRYSQDELLSLRESFHVVYCPIEKIHQPSTLDIILRVPKEAFEKPQTFYCTTKDLIEEYKRHRQGASDSSGGDRSTEQSFAEEQMHHQLDRNNQQVHWLLRGHDHTERIAQPYSAPTNLATQQSENFQRFYRAVVSPTHVRVTAGGRIVPNTRTPAPPVFEWNGDKFLFEPRQQHITPASSQPDGAWTQATSDLPNQPLANNLSPIGNFLPGFQPIYNQPRSLVPAIMANQNTKPSPEGHKSPSGNKTSPPANPEPVKLSPPAQFDQTKPFLYNGHWVFPVPPGFQPPPNAQALPLSMLGNPRMAPQVAQPVAFPVHNQPIYPGNPLGIVTAGQQHPVMLANGAHGTASTFQSADVHVVPQPNVMHPIPVSQFTKMQIQSTRSQIKQIDDIMTNNREAFDLGHMDLTRQALLKAVEQMEILLCEQLNNPQAKAEDFITVDPSYAVKPIRMEKPLHKEESVYRVESRRQAELIYKAEPIHNGESAHRRQLVQGHEGENSGKSSDVPHSEPKRKSRLSASAAMAPPFKPRPQALRISSTQPITQGEFSRRPEETVEQSEARLLAAATTDWNETRTSYVKPNNSHGPPTMQKSHTMHVTHPRRARGHINTHDGYVKRGNTFHGQSEAVSSMAESLVFRQGVPYLVGINDHTSNQLTYPRELTEEELRARHLYWGKAPRSAQKGLPKFDGKDFYPASPVKEYVHPIGAESPVKPLHTGRVPKFATLFTDNPDSPFKSPSTPAPDHKSINDTLSPSRGAGYTSPQSRSSGYINNGTGYNEMLRDFSTPENRTHGSFTPTFQGGLKGEFNQLFPGDPLKFAHPASHAYGANMNHGDFTVSNTTRAVSIETDTANKMANLVLQRDDDTESVDSWGLPKPKANKAVSYGTAGKEQTSTDIESDTSTVEIHLTPQPFKQTSTKTLTGTFEERVAAVNNPEQQNKFLQDILNNTAKAAPPLSGSISNMTAQGYLPQYRGFAAASLAPAMNYSPAERGFMKDIDKNLSPMGSSGFMSENRPFNDSARAGPSPMTAEEYMRLVASRPHEGNRLIADKGTGPVAGSDW